MTQKVKFHPNVLKQTDDKHSVAFRMPLVEICGRNRVLIENHLGIYGYATEEITVKVRCGCIHVLGCNLRVSKVCKEKLIILGRIDSVRFCGRE